MHDNYNNARLHQLARIVISTASSHPDQYRPGVGSGGWRVDMQLQAAFHAGD